jgi:hypothetical protein
MRHRFRRRRPVDDPFRRRHRLDEAGIDGPPMWQTVEHDRTRIAANDLVGTGTDRPSFGKVEIAEAARVLALPDMLWHHDEACGLTSGEEILSPARTRFGEVDQHGVRIDGLGTSHPFLDGR